MMKALAVMAVWPLLGACTGAGSTVPASVDAPAPSIVETTPQPSASAPSPRPADAWGPLAVRPPEDGADTARTEGTLRITDSCVYLDAAGHLALLTWPADRTTWNGASHEITFVNFDGTVVTIGDGEDVGLGGGGDSAAESGISGEDWISGLDWVAPPASSCSLDSRWAVGAVEGETTAVASIDPSAILLRLAPANLGCDSFPVPYREATFRIDPTAPEHVTAIADNGTRLSTFWSADFRGGSGDDPVVRDSAGRLVASDGEAIAIPEHDWPRLNGYFVCPTGDKLFILSTDPS